MELTLVGLQNSGKTTFVNVIAVSAFRFARPPLPDAFNAFPLVQSGHFNEDMIPTVGFNMRKVTKGNVTIKVRRSQPRGKKKFLKSDSLRSCGISAASRDSEACGNDTAGASVVLCKNIER